VGRICTYDLNEAKRAVAKVYCPHELMLKRTERSLDTALETSGPSQQPIVRLRYGAAVSVDAGRFLRLFLVMTCTRGKGFVSQERRSREWFAGTTLPVSAGLGTKFEFGREFAQTTVRLDVDLLERLCGRWLGHPLPQSVRFDLRPFSTEFQQTWGHVLALMESSEALRLPLAAAASFEEYVLTLLLHGHPHNFSDALREPTSCAATSVVKRAELFIEEHSNEPITLSDIAAYVNTSVRSLQAGFKSSRNTTPMAFLRHVRLQHVRRELVNATQTTTVTDVALRWGFLHLGRFSQMYKTVFNENPAMTLRRALPCSAE
jgi:AraC-like DNA-binding protein